MGMYLSALREMKAARPVFIDDEEFDVVGGCSASCKTSCGTTCTGTCTKTKDDKTETEEL